MLAVYSLLTALDPPRMAVDTPAKIAVLGAGPVGLEAALYARFLGYDVAIYERAGVAAHVRRFAHVRWFTPFGMNVSPLGLAALAAQRPEVRFPAADAVLTAGELAEAYWLPLAETDLLVDCLQQRTEVVAISRGELLKGELVGQEARREWPFRLLLRQQEGTAEPRELLVEADVVIDATGTFGQPNPLGAGGIPAIGEAGLEDRLEHRLPDILGARRGDYANRHTLVVGGGHTAATNVVALAELAQAAPETRITWLVRREGEAGHNFPLVALAEDSLPERRALAAAANALATQGAVRLIAGRGVAALAELSSGQIEVTLTGSPAQSLAVDRVLANVGFRPDNRLLSELQVHECYATAGPMKLAAALLAAPSADCLSQPACGPATLLNPEPDFYVLGAKSYGRRSQFLLASGIDQVRQVFTIIGDRADLDLYATIGKGRR
jgi:thioredoxin reductase